MLIGLLIGVLILSAWWIYENRDAIEEWLNQSAMGSALVQGIKWIIDAVQWLTANIPRIPGIGEKGANDLSTGSALGDSAIDKAVRWVKFGTLWDEVLGFARGGIVPGQRGSAVPILAHAGEAILTPRMQAGLMNALNGLAAGPSAFAPPTSALSQSMTHTEIRVDVGGITIKAAPGMDEKAIAKAAGTELQRAMRDLIADSDGPIQR